MSDKVVAIFALLVFIGFLGILVIWVPEPDLVVVTVVVVAMAIYEFWRSLFGRRNGR